MSESRQVQFTKRIMKDAFLELLQEKPLSKINVKELCAKADVNRSTFYDHYENIDYLIREVEEEMADQIGQSMEVLYTGENYQRDMVRDMFSRITRNPELLIWLVDDRTTGLAREKILTYSREICFPEWQRVSGFSEEELDRFLTFIADGAFAFLKQWYDSGFAEDAKVIEEQFDAIVYNTLSYIYGR